MDTTQRLLTRLNEIGQSLKNSGHALALLGLGSVGQETARIDQFSDLDFFAIVEEGHKQRYVDNLDWLETVRPVAYAFKNTPDGCKLLFDDGIFCEYAVFEPRELVNIPFAAGRVVWSTEGFDPVLLSPPPRQPSTRELDWYIGEAVTNLYVGLQRYHRGEKLSALFFIQFFAVARITEIAEKIETPLPAFPDIYASERRFEARFPTLAQHLPKFLQGYDHTVESARAILTFLETHFSVNAAIKAEIIKLLEYRP